MLRELCTHFLMKLRATFWHLLKKSATFRQLLKKINNFSATF